MDFNQFVMLLEIIGPAGILGMIYFIRRLTDRMDATNAAINNTNEKLDKFIEKLDNMGKMISHEHRKVAADHSREHKEIAAELSREHSDIEGKIDRNNENVTEKVEKIMTDHQAHDRQNTRVETKVDELVEKSRKVA